MVHSPAPSPGTLSFPPLDPRQAPARLPTPPTVEGETGGVKGRDRTGHSPAWQNGHFTSGPYRPACCGVTLAQPQCHWRHDTKTLCHSEVQRCVCSWQDPALATPPCPPQLALGQGGARRTLDRPPSHLRPGPAAGSLVMGCVCSQAGLGGVWMPRREVSHWLRSPYYLIGSPQPVGLEGHDVHDVAKNYRGHHPATELCRTGVRDEQGPRCTSKGGRLHGLPQR